MATYLFTWNPDKWYWENLGEEARRTAHGQLVTGGGWSCGNTKRIRVGDRAFLIKLGPREPRGIFASGWVSGAPHQDSHWDADRAEGGELALYVDIDFDRIVDPQEHSRSLVPFSLLKKGKLKSVHWSTQRSGILIQTDPALELERVWGRRLDHLDSLQHSGELDEDIVALEGKTRIALILHKSRERRLRIAKIIEGLRSGNGRLKCEVPGCGFDFLEPYGELGREYAQVHHLKALGDRTAPSKTKLSDRRRLRKLPRDDSSRRKVSSSQSLDQAIGET